MKKFLAIIFAVVLFASSVSSVEASVVLEDGREVYEPVLVSDALYYDSHGAEAYGWEIEEAMRLMMLECGSYKVSEADKREHCAVLCKQLLYTQTVDGYNGWGTTLWGVMHASNTYLQTAPRIWDEEAEPTEEIAAIFWDVWCNGYSTDFRVQSYRSDYHFEDYYSGGDWAINAYSIGTTYYSRNYWQDFSMFDLGWDGVLGYSEWEPVEVENENDWFRPEEAVIMYER